MNRRLVVKAADHAGPLAGSLLEAFFFSPVVPSSYPFHSQESPAGTEFWGDLGLASPNRNQHCQGVV